MFPTYMEFTTPQNRSGSSDTSCGPGLTPWMSKAPKMTAIVALAGIPNVSSGMNDEVAAALLAVSGEATPSMAPFPNRDGSLARRFSTAYATNDAIVAPPPGRMPRRNPSTDPRPMAPDDCRRSFLDGQTFATRAGSCSARCRSSRL